MGDDLTTAAKELDDAICELREVVEEMVAELGCEHKTLPAASALIQ